MGFTHVEFMPISEHPLMNLGYQTVGYAPDQPVRHALTIPFLVDTLHQAGIGILPIGFCPRPATGTASRISTAPSLRLATAQGALTEWGTYIFSYGRPKLRIS